MNIKAISLKFSQFSITQKASSSNIKVSFAYAGKIAFACTSKLTIICCRSNYLPSLDSKNFHNFSASTGSHNALENIIFIFHTICVCMLPHADTKINRHTSITNCCCCFSLHFFTIQLH